MHTNMMLFLRLRKVFCYFFRFFHCWLLPLMLLRPVVGVSKDISVMESTVIFLRTLVSLQCSDTVGWTTGMASSLYTAESCFVGGDDLTGALHILQLQLSPPPPSSLAPIKSRMATFWYRLKPRVVVESGH